MTGMPNFDIDLDPTQASSATQAFMQKTEIMRKYGDYPSMKRNYITKYNVLKRLVCSEAPNE